jgi:hypothetical protein
MDGWMDGWIFYPKEKEQVSVLSASSECEISRWVTLKIKILSSKHCHPKSIGE